MQGWERPIYTYQSEDPIPTIPTYKMNEKKGTTVEENIERAAQAIKKALAQLLKPASPTPIENTVSKMIAERL